MRVINETMYKVDGYEAYGEKDGTSKGFFDSEKVAKDIEGDIAITKGIITDLEQVLYRIKKTSLGDEYASIHIKKSDEELDKMSDEERKAYEELLGTYLGYSENFSNIFKDYLRVHATINELNDYVKKIAGQV